MTDEELARRVRYHTLQDDNAEAFAVVVDWYLTALEEKQARPFSEIILENVAKGNRL